MKKLYLLEAKDWLRLVEPYRMAFGEIDTLPSPDVSQCVVTEIDGEIQGFLFIQHIVHVEPLASLHPEVSCNEMRQFLEQEFALDHYVSYTSDSRLDQAMVAAGFMPVGVLWSKVV